jgi:hypothetical protein
MKRGNLVSVATSENGRDYQAACALDRNSRLNSAAELPVSGNPLSIGFKKLRAEFHRDEQEQVYL